MKKIIVLMMLILFSAASLADTQVRGYYKQDGTYVQPHYRSDTNNSQYDNWSTKGNINPHTGEPGYKNPDQNYQRNW